MIQARLIKNKEFTSSIVQLETGSSLDCFNGGTETKLMETF